MDAQRLSAIILLFDIFIHEDIFFISLDDIFIIAGCISIMLEQRLLFIMALVDMRLHDIIVFISADDICIFDIDEWLIVLGVCARPGMAAVAARAIIARNL